ncbi:MAG: tetratricopeptide repeat protein [Candidatus Omnitrophota bacterium]|nr:tetratricopeptide repeat protein [Candidatus Omnitrophota bacterium]
MRNSIRDTKTGVLLGLLLVVTAVVFGRTLTHDFINYDDIAYVTGNERVQEGLTLKNIEWAFTTKSISNWHPLTWLSHMLDCNLFGLNAGGHHFSSLLLHLANVLLVFLLFLRMTGDAGKSFFVAAMMGWHPLHVESVAWVAERKDVLSAFLGLLACHAYVKYAASPGAKRDYGWTMLWFALGLTAKPMLVTLPFVFVLFDIWPLRRICAGRELASQAAGCFVEKIPLFILTAVSCVITYEAQHTGGAMIPVAVHGLAERTANSVVAYASYLGKTLWPLKLGILYPLPPEIQVLKVLLSATVLAAVTFLVLINLKARPYAAVGWFYFLGTLVPVIGLVQVGEQAMADRYMYLPIIGLAVLGAWAVPDLLARVPGAQKVIRPAVVAVLAVLAVLTFRQAGYWQNSEKLLAHTLEVTDNNPVVHYNMGHALVTVGKYPEAIEHLKDAVRIDPRYLAAYEALGVSYSRNGDLSQALAVFQDLKTKKADHPKLEYQLGHVLKKMGKFDLAMGHFEKAIEQDPKDADALIQIAEIYGDRGEDEKAAEIYDIVRRLDPKNPAIFNEVAMAYTENGDYDKAVDLFERGVEKRPFNADLRFNLGVTYAHMGRRELARGSFARAVSLDNAHVEALTGLGVLAYEDGDYERAVELYKKATQIRSDMGVAYYNLGLAHSKLGVDAEALAAYRQAEQTGYTPAKLYSSMGHILNNMKQYSEAKEQLENAVKTEPDNYRAQYQLGVACAETGDRAGLERSIQILRRLKQSPYADRLRSLYPAPPLPPERQAEPL